MSEDCGERSASEPDQRAEARGREWLRANREWIERYNADVEVNGVWSDGKRLF